MSEQTIYHGGYYVNGERVRDLTPEERAGWGFPETFSLARLPITASLYSTIYAENVFEGDNDLVTHGVAGLAFVSNVMIPEARDYVGFQSSWSGDAIAAALRSAPPLSGPRIEFHTGPRPAHPSDAGPDTLLATFEGEG